MENSRRDGMITMDRALKNLYDAGKVHYEDVLRYVTSPTAVPAHEADLEIAKPR